MSEAAVAPEGFAEHNAERFQRAREACPDGHMVCGIKGEPPVYFSIHADATDEEIAQRAFEVRNGRPMSQAEEILSREARLRGKL